MTSITTKAAAIFKQIIIKKKLFFLQYLLQFDFEKKYIKEYRSRNKYIYFFLIARKRKTIFSMRLSPGKKLHCCCSCRCKSLILKAKLNFSLTHLHYCICFSLFFFVLFCSCKEINCALKVKQKKRKKKSEICNIKSLFGLLFYL